MPRAKPPVQRQCLCCDQPFMGTPAATRCDPCKAAGLKVPRERQQARRKKPVPVVEKTGKQHRQPEKIAKPVPQHERTCGVCGEDFTTHKAKAARCDQCIAEDRPVKRRKCICCGSIFPDPLGEHYRCEPCREIAEANGVNLFDDAKREAERQREELRKKRWLVGLKALMAELKARDRPPKGYHRMSATTAEQPIGLLWRQLVYADGAASSITYTAPTTSGLSEADKLALLTAYFRLRVRGYFPSQIALLCPIALLQSETQAAIADLPEVDADAEELTMSDEQNLEARAAALGLLTEHPIHNNQNQGTDQ